MLPRFPSKSTPRRNLEYLFFSGKALFPHTHSPFLSFSLSPRRSRWCCASGQGQHRPAHWQQADQNTDVPSARNRDTQHSPNPYHLQKSHLEKKITLVPARHHLIPVHTPQGTSSRERDAIRGCVRARACATRTESRETPQKTRAARNIGRVIARGVHEARVSCSEDTAGR